MSAWKLSLSWNRLLGPSRPARERSSFAPRLHGILGGGTSSAVASRGDSTKGDLP